MAMTATAEWWPWPRWLMRRILLFRPSSLELESSSSTAAMMRSRVDRRGDDIGGVAVHAASRIASQAVAGEVLVSSTVKQLCAGAGIEFRTRGERSLKGLDDAWALFEVVDAVPVFARSN